MRIKVVHVERGWDMRRKHDLREGLHAQRLKRGQCLVAFNVARTMARVIDSEWGFTITTKTRASISKG